MLTYAPVCEASHSYKKVKMYTLGNLHEHFTNFHVDLSFKKIINEMKQTKYPRSF